MADYTIKRNDTAPVIKATLSDANGAINLSTAKTIHIYLKQEDKPVVKTTTMTVVDAEKGEVEYQWQAGDLAEAGEYQMEFEIIWGDDTKTTVPNEGYKVLKVEADLAEPKDLE